MDFLPALNFKCIVVSAAVVGLAALHPYCTPWAALSDYDMKVHLLYYIGVALVAYLGVTWYDHLYSCQSPPEPSFLSFLTYIFKPAPYREKFMRLPPAKYWTIVAGDLAVLSGLGYVLYFR